VHVAPACTGSKEWSDRLRTITNLGQMALNPSGVASPKVATIPKGRDMILDLFSSCLTRRDTISSIYRWSDLDLKELISIIKGIS
jgi:hypothetical protein